MTCRKFKRCSNYQLGRYECDHTGENCQNFAEKKPQGIDKLEPCLFEASSHFGYVDKLKAVIFFLPVMRS